MQVFSLVIFPRMDCCQNPRNRNWQIYIGNNAAPNWASNALCTNVPFDITPPTIGSGPYSTTVICPAAGRYVQIVRPYSAVDHVSGNNILSVCELKVCRLYCAMLLNVSWHALQCRCLLSLLRWLPSITRSEVVSFCDHLQVYANVTSSGSASGQPAARMGHAATMYRGQMVIAGGMGVGGTQLSDVQVGAACVWIHARVRVRWLLYCYVCVFACICALCVVCIKETTHVLPFRSYPCRCSTFKQTPGLSSVPSPAQRLLPECTLPCCLPAPTTPSHSSVAPVPELPFLTSTSSRFQSVRHTVGLGRL
jgi:hypothetical protein